LKKKKNKPPEKSPIPKLGQLKESKSSAKLRTTMTRTTLRNSKGPTTSADEGDKTKKAPTMQRVKSWRFGAKGTGVKTAKDEQKVIESMIDDIIDSLAPTK